MFVIGLYMYMCLYIIEPSSGIKNHNNKIKIKIIMLNK